MERKGEVQVRYGRQERQGPPHVVAVTLFSQDFRYSEALFRYCTMWLGMVSMVAWMIARK